MTGPFDVCQCGRIYKVHPLEDCRGFTPAEDPNAATEAARAAGEHRDRTYKELRRAVASWHFGRARELLEELVAAER